VTGQPAQCRAVDPDGTLLAAAYDAGTPAERERLRSVLALHRDFDLVRIVVGERRRLLSSDERDYLVERLAGRGDWDRLWQLIQDLPLGAAIEAAPRFGAWRPADPRAKDLLRRLVDAGARGDLAALTEPDGRWPELPVSLRVPGHVRACGVSPDGSRLAVVAASEPIDVDYAEYALDSATRLYHHGHSGYGHYYHDESRHRVHCEADELLHLGDMIIVAETLTYPRGHGRRPERFLMRYTRYGERELWQGDLMSGPYAFDGGYVVCVSGRTLIFGRGDDDWAVRREEDLGQWLDDRCPSRAQAQLLDTDPPTGRILVRRGDWIAVLDGREGTVIAYGVGGRNVREATFTGREHLVTCERHGRRSVVRKWRIRRRRSGGSPGRLTPSPKPVAGDGTPTDTPTRRLAALRDWDRIAVHPPGEAAAFVDSRTLRAAGPPVPCAFTPRKVLSKASDPFLLFSDGDGGIEIHVSLWGEMLRRPMAEATPRRLEWATRATTDARCDETLREALGLYRAFLELRFG
jgi:hypothetical protein